jgi:hypothetical protein
VVYIEFGGSWGELGGVPRSSEELVRFGSHYTPSMYTGYGYFLAEYKYLYQVFFQKMFYKRLRCFLELIHNVTQMTPDDKSSKKCFQRSKKIQSRYAPSMAAKVLRLWDLQDMF